MKNLISARQFLTILPIGRPGTFAPGGMLPWFPIAGLIIGAMLSCFDMAVSSIFAEPAAALLDVIFIILITAAFHLDGLGDTADGLYGNIPREKALAIMKDSRVGTMGVVAIFCGLSVKWAGIAELDAHRHLFLLVIPAYARGGTLFGFRFLEYGRPGGGTGHALFEERQLGISDFWGMLIPVTLSLFAGWQGIWLNLVFALTVISVLLFYKKRMGCITGDMLGAMTETVESVLFLTVSVM